MDFQKLSKYELVEERKLPDLGACGYLLRHKKSGARLFLVDAKDENKVFSIGFRTPPIDSTGLTHILEHSVLCGSKEFPVKDPFVELAKGSLNTFLNAMTYPDKTVYPVASCNDKDFQNLIHVYLDAVFYPNIYRREEIFKQEGWHYELESPEDELALNGVVYNEMKGAFSSADDVVSREVFNSLFPDTPYGFESGGDPEVIPELSYERFLDFHASYYHPSNSYIYLYGDMDFEEKLLWMDQHYLSNFDAKEIATQIPLQKPFVEKRIVEKAYSVAEKEDEKEATYLAYNVSFGSALDRKMSTALEVLEYALVTAPGAPLKQALLDAGIGKDIVSYSENGILQPFFSVVAKECEKEQAKDFEDVIRQVLHKIVEEGFEKKTLLATICGLEFRYREADAGRFPIGLTYGLECMDSWLYDETDPFMHLERNEVYAELKDAVEKGFFENLVKEYLLDNPHASLVVVEPKWNLNGELEEALRKKLQEYKDSLSKEEIEYLVEDTIHLKAYQDEPSSQEDLMKIPLLEISDIRKEVLPIQNKEVRMGDTLMVYHDYETKGIGYSTLLFQADDLTERELQYLSFLGFVLGYVDTKSYGFRDLTDEINIHTGGISSTVNVYTDNRAEDATRIEFAVKMKALFSENDAAFAIWKEILTTSNLRDEKRLREILAKMRSRLQMYMISSGHSLAYLRGSTYFSESSKSIDLISGIDFYHFVCELSENFEEKKTEIMEELCAICSKVITRERLIVSITAKSEMEEEFVKQTEALKESLPSGLMGQRSSYSVEKKNEGFRTASKVNYVARCGNFKTAGLPYHGALKILKMALSYDYLWLNVRVKGGAYGCMSGFDRAGDSYFVSYRDPHVSETQTVFEGIYDYVKNFDVNERDMTKFIIGTISMMDTPLTPSAAGARSMSHYESGLSIEALQKERDQVLAADCASIRSLAPYIEAILKGEYICVIGDENKIEKEKELFSNLETLS